MSDANDLSELFARDPFKLTDQDIDTIIAKYIEARRHFATTGKQASAAKPAASLADLGLL